MINTVFQTIKKPLIILTAVFLLVGQLHYFIHNVYFPGIEVVFTTAQLLALALMIMDGSLINNMAYIKASLWLAIPFAIGALMRMMHYPNAWKFLRFCIIGFAVIYTMHYTKKSTKNLFDHSKLFWFTLSCLSAVWIFLKLPGYLTVKDIPRVIFTFVFLIYTTQKFIAVRLPAN